MTIQGHIHLQLTTDPAEANEFHVKFDGMWDETPSIPVVVDRALDATLHYARILDNSGEPKRINNSRMTLLLEKSQVAMLLNLVAKPICFIPIDHSNDGDSSGHTADRRPVIIILKPNSLTPIDVGGMYWNVGIEVIDND